MQFSLKSMDCCCDDLFVGLFRYCIVMRSKAQINNKSEFVVFSHDFCENNNKFSIHSNIIY